MLILVRIVTFEKDIFDKLENVPLLVSGPNQYPNIRRSVMS